MPASADTTFKKTSQFVDTGWKVVSILGAVGSMIVFLVLAWVKINDNATDIDVLQTEMKEVTLKHDHDDLNEKVTRQYSTHSAAQDKMRAEIDIIKAWIEWRKGYDQASKELKK